MTVNSTSPFLGTTGTLNWQPWSNVYPKFTTDCHPIRPSLMLYSLLPDGGVTVKTTLSLFQYPKLPSHHLHLSRVFESRSTVDCHLINTSLTFVNRVTFTTRNVRDSLPDDVAKTVAVSIVTTRLECRLETLQDCSVYRTPSHVSYCGSENSIT